MSVFGQSDIHDQIKTLNGHIDLAIIQKDITFLQKHYADDFVFTHGTGTIDDKESWLKAVQNREQVFISRQHDSTTVELHANIALVFGLLNVTRKDSGTVIRYGLRFIRVYRKDGEVWRMISHRTTDEWHY
jgi:ketosteroid isomerase-like protein